ncbi:MAG: amidohydrolase [Candidatus Latescibacteria bacterium]|nr:amidohydrolase [Candidatus Latescibacterota bacterium]
MTIVDTHCHVGLYKYEPLESLLYHMNTSGVDRAVFIQYAGNSDNQYMLDSMAAQPENFQAAMIVDPTDDGTTIRQWAEQDIVGIRLPANSRADCADPLAQWRTAAELDLVVSAPSNPQSLLSDEFAEVLREFPNLSIVIEHLAGIGEGQQPPYDTFKKILELAEQPNLSIKLPGFGEICPVPLPFDPIPPLADMTIEAFGPQRVMWGSDYPPVSRREGYDNSLKVPMDYLSDLSEEDREWIFGKTALKIWRF